MYFIKKLKMKKFTKLMAVSVLVLSCLQTATAQEAKTQKKAAKAEAIKKMIDSANYVFEANYVIPLRGGSKQLTSDYDFKVSKDTITAFLPYYGQAYVAPVSDPNEGGIKFTTANYSYTTKARKNGGWEILIKPKDRNISDWRDVQSLMLTVSANGYASLQVLSSNRDAITFDGTIEKVGVRD